jgi:hypothetical protein
LLMLFQESGKRGIKENLGEDEFKYVFDTW